MREQLVHGDLNWDWRRWVVGCLENPLWWWKEDLRQNQQGTGLRACVCHSVHSDVASDPLTSVLLINWKCFHDSPYKHAEML